MDQKVNEWLTWDLHTRDRVMPGQISDQSAVM